MELVSILTLTIALAAVTVATLSWLTTRRKDASDEKAERRASEFDELRTMNQVLRVGLADAQKEATTLKTDLATAQLDLDKVNRGLNAALANMTILNIFIDEHVPKTVTRPALRRVM